MINIYSPIEVDEESLLRDDEKHELLYSKINVLPENIQDLLFNEATDNTIKQISLNLQLNQNQTMEMSRLVRDIAIGDIYLGNIIDEVAKQLKVEPGMAKEIASQIINQVFAPALEDLKKLHMEKFPGKQMSQPAPIPPAPVKKDNDINPNNVLDLSKKS